MTENAAQSTKKPSKPLILIIIAAVALLVLAGIFVPKLVEQARQHKLLEAQLLQASTLNDEASAALSSGQSGQALLLYCNLLKIKNTQAEQLYPQAVEGVLKSATALLQKEGEGYLAILDDDIISTLHPVATKGDMLQFNRIKSYALGKNCHLQGKYLEAQKHYLESEELLDAGAMVQNCLSEQLVIDVNAALDNRDLALAAQLLDGRQDASAAELRVALSNQKEGIMASLFQTYQNRIGAGAWYSVGIDNSPLIFGDEKFDSNELPKAAEKVFCGPMGMVFINEGRASLFGDVMGTFEDKIAQAKGISSAAVGLCHLLLLQQDGTVLAFGSNAVNQCLTSDWVDIISVAAGAYHSVGLKSDGTVIAVGGNEAAQLNTADWSGIVSIAAGLNHTVALKADGTVVASGDNSYGQCNVQDWSNVIAIACGLNHTLALTNDYKVLATGDNSTAQCNVSQWEDVIAIAGGIWHSVALRADGRVIATGSNDNGQCNIHNIQLINLTSDGKSFNAEHPACNELVYVASWGYGPWLYIDSKGCAALCFDLKDRVRILRADIFCTKGVAPIGIVSGGGNRPSGMQPGYLLARVNHSVLALTGDYYNFGYNKDGLQLRCGNIIRENNEEISFAFFPDGTMQKVTTEKYSGQQLLDMGIRDSWTFGPVLVDGGTKQDISANPLSYNDVTHRTAIATFGRHHHVALVTNNLTLDTVQNSLVDWGVLFAYNLDGGRSTSMVFMGKAVNRSDFVGEEVRHLQDMIGFLSSDSVK